MNYFQNWTCASVPSMEHKKPSNDTKCNSTGTHRVSRKLSFKKRMTIDYRPVFGLIIIIGIFTDIIILSLKLVLVVRFDEMKWMAFLISVQANDQIEYRILFALAKLTELNNEYYSCCEIYSNNIQIVQDIRIFLNYL